jgi:hypothetical protein
MNSIRNLRRQEAPPRMAKAPIGKLAKNLLGGTGSLLGAGGGNLICAGVGDEALKLAGIKGVKADVIGNQIVGGRGVGFLNAIGAFVADNRIAGSLGPAISMQNKVAVEFARNLVADNQERPIELVKPGGVVEPDPGDSDDGPNGLQNYPFLGAARSETGGGILARIGLLTKPKGKYRLELFGASACSSTGQVAAEIFLGAQTLNTKASGLVSELISLPADPGGLPFVAATVTDLESKRRVTSEFSACTPVADEGEPAVGITPSSLEVKRGEVSAEVECLDSAPCEGAATLEDRDADEEYATFSIGLFSGSKTIKLPLNPVAKLVLAEQKRLQAELSASINTSTGLIVRDVNVLLRKAR